MAQNTPQQQRIIDTLDSPLSVAAGAGSGKTYTLTQRIVGAFFPNNGREPLLDSIEQVLAITFTRKAALELKNRIKSQLSRRGLVEESLRVDDAWITTIHGMCSNLLKEHALEFGLDPAFELLDEPDAEVYFERAANKALARIRVGEEGPRLLKLVEENTWTSTSEFPSSLLKDARALLEKYRALPGGAAAVRMAAPSATPNILLRKMYEVGFGYRDLVEGFSKTNSTDEKHLNELLAALDLTNAYFAEGPVDDFVAPDFDSEGYLDVLFAYPKTSPKYKGNARNAYPEFFADYRQLYGEVLYEALACIGASYAQDIFTLAQLLDAAYQEEKGTRYLDQTDLLVKTAQALQEHPEVAHEYRKRFRLVMVDEFQDTDRLQVAIVRALAAEDGSNICTVGDAQQSIYRFRGADVSVFFDVQREMVEQHGDCVVELPDNFRSHGDVLAFVEEVFSQPNAFGEKFLRLSASGSINSTIDPAFKREPRIEIMTVESTGRWNSAKKAEPIAAREIAARFARLREAGVSPSEMVILFRKMSSIGPYVAALQDEGFESLITGGSVFAQQSEVQSISALCRWLANALDSEALYQVLASDMCNISDTALLEISRAGFAKRNDQTKLARGFFTLESDDFETVRVQDFMREALHRTQAGGLVAGVRYALATSGWLHRLERAGSNGVFQAGNIMKAIRELERFENDGLGVSETAEAFNVYLAGSKEKPGTLSSDASNYVRLMTIHASKGLEFGHVAVVLPDANNKSGKFLVETVGDCCYVSGGGDVGGDGERERTGRSSKIKELKKNNDDEALPKPGIFDEHDPAGFRMALEQRLETDEKEEAQRLFYVAATRAVKSLHVVFPHKASSAKARDFGTTYVDCGVVEDVRTAFTWDEPGQDYQQMFTCGESTKVLFRNLVVPTDTDGEDEEGDFDVADHAVFWVPTKRPFDRVSLKPYTPDRIGVFSYSSLPHGKSSIDADGTRDASSMSVGHAEAFNGDMRMFAVSSGAFGGSGEIDADGVSGDWPFSKNGESTDDAIATDLGTAFHRLAQRAILESKRDGATGLVCPAKDSIAAQVKSCSLSTGQKLRLEQALERWCNSACARELVARGNLYAEVPFYVMISHEDATCYLEGEIDALADDGEGSAYLVDYKTGGSPDDTAEEVQARHRLQAQCYAYALMRKGYKQVDATFVRVEQSDPSNPGEPQTVHYVFESNDLPLLEAIILAHWDNSAQTKPNETASAT